MLYLVPVPIWNLWDITVRWLDKLKSIDIIVCESTANIISLYRHFDIPFQHKKFHHLSSYTWDTKLWWLADICKNSDVVLVSDAGTPWLSDPAKSIIKLCREHDIRFEVLPWACALIPAVVGMYADTSHFEYLWFLPQKKWRQTILKYSMLCEHTIVFYESVHRIAKLLKELEWFEGTVHIARELTKFHEQKITWSVSDVVAMLQNWSLVLKGEFVIWMSQAKPSFSRSISW